MAKLSILAATLWVALCLTSCVNSAPTKDSKKKPETKPFFGFHPPVGHQPYYNQYQPGYGHYPHGYGHGAFPVSHQQSQYYHNSESGGSIFNPHHSDTTYSTHSSFGNRFRRDLSRAAEIKKALKSVTDVSDDQDHSVGVDSSYELRETAFKDPHSSSRIEVNLDSIPVTHSKHGFRSDTMISAGNLDGNAFLYVGEKDCRPTGVVAFNGFSRNTSISCLKDGDALIAKCGKHFLFPGDKIRLVADQLNCQWHIRYKTPNLEIVYPLDVEDERFEVARWKLDTVNRFKRSGRTQVTHEDILIKYHGPRNADTGAEVCATQGTFPSGIYEFPGNCCEELSYPSCGKPFYNKQDKSQGFSEGNFPWLAQITASSAEGREDCSGVLISDTWILTTAVCFMRFQHFPEVTVIFHGSKESGPVRGQEVVLFPYTSTSHNIALLRLRKPVKLNPVCLPSYKKHGENKDLIGTRGTVLARKDGKSFKKLNEDFYDVSKCAFSSQKVLNPHSFCSKNSKPRECYESRIFVGKHMGRYYVRGLPDDSSCQNDLPIYTSVKHFMPWISTVTGIPIPY